MPFELADCANTEYVVVFDVGARFGIHPSWRAVARSAAVRYLAFDVDGDEVVRLNRKYSKALNYKAIHQGFSDGNEELVLNVLAHRGQSSFYPPKLDSTWFGGVRREDAAIVSRQAHRVMRLDDFCGQSRVQPDFLKIDTEGFDFKILKGADSILGNVLAIRCEVLFEQNFEGAGLFPDIFAFLKDRGFRLGNMDYDGRGVPASYFCPDPMRFGVLVGGEAVFIRTDQDLKQMPVLSKVKFCLFCLLNNLQDLALVLLLELSTQDPAKVVPPAIWSELKRLFCINARKLLYVPGDSYLRAMKDFEAIFGEAFPDQHRFFESNFLNPD